MVQFLDEAPGARVRGAISVAGAGAIRRRDPGADKAPSTGLAESARDGGVPQAGGAARI